MYNKVFHPILVRCKDTQGKTDKTDISMIVTDPNWSDLPSVNMIGIGGGHYQSSFIPNLCGRWIVRIICLSNPRNNFSREYFVAQETVPNLQGEENTYVGKTLGSTVGANKIHCNLWNNSGSTIKIQKILAHARIDATGTGQFISFEGIRTSSQGTGIFINVIGLDSLAPALTGISFINNFSTNPTVLTNGELFGYNLDMEESRSGTGYIDVFKSGNGVSPIIVRPGEGFCIKQNTLIGAGKTSIFYYFTLA